MINCCSQKSSRVGNHSAFPILHYSTLQQAHYFEQHLFSYIYPCLENNTYKIYRNYDRIDILNTICSATEERQSEARKIAARADAMIVIGGRHSSNTCKLRDVCSENTPTFLIETASELSGIDFSPYKVVGVTARASTPSVIIKEVLKTMSEEIKEKEVETT